MFQVAAPLRRQAAFRGPAQHRLAVGERGGGLAGLLVDHLVDDRRAPLATLLGIVGGTTVGLITGYFLGIVDEVPYFAATVDRDGEDWLTLRDLGPTIGDLGAGLLTSAIALEQWHQRHTHCPLCGVATLEANSGWIRTCPSDGSEHYPRTDPAVIMLIHDGAELALLGRGVQWGSGRFSTLAGFVEPGESLEAAVAREVFEEVGVEVCDIRYVASQPWPFPSSLMLGFSGRLDGDPTIALDPVEIAEAGWFTRAEVQQAADWVDAGADPEPGVRIQGVSPKLSISRYLIDLWLAGELPG